MERRKDVMSHEITLTSGYLRDNHYHKYFSRVKEYSVGEIALGILYKSAEHVAQYRYLMGSSMT